METVGLSPRQSARAAELLERYRVLRVERSAAPARKPTRQSISNQPNGRMTAAAIAARRRLAAVVRQRSTN